MQIAFILLLFLVLFAKSRPTRWNERYIDKETTSTINGLFIWLVFMSHFTQYLLLNSGNLVGNTFGQLVVVMFLFYSGYGCAVQYLANGESYLRTFPQKRILATLINFDIAVCAFVVVAFMLGKPLTVCQVLLSFICWESVGNSNWYVFVILLCYALFWLSAGVVRRKREWQVWQVILIVFLAIFVFVLSRVRPGYWYGTMMAFGAGAVYGINRGRIEALVKKNYVICLAVAVLLFVTVEHIPWLGQKYWITHNIKSIAFAAIVVMATMKILVRSVLLRWSGEHLFPLYIYQRIPMMIFVTLHPAAFKDSRCWFYFVLSAIVVISIATLYHRFRYPLLAK